MIVSESMVQAMRPGSVVVDIAADSGGNCAATVPGEATTTPHGVKVLGWRNWPARIPVAAVRHVSLQLDAKPHKVVLEPVGINAMGGRGFWRVGVFADDAVVDPGVGTARRAVAVQTPGGVLVGPDNGLLAPAIETLGGPEAVVELTNPAWHAPTVSRTFHGRDVFAPVAARLAGGAPLSGAGTSIEPASLVRLPEPVVMVGDGYLEAEVTAVDRFGNVQLAATGTSLDALDEHLLVGGVHAVRGGTFADAPPGELIVFVDSAERVAVAINGGRAVVALSVSPGDVLRIDNA